MEECSVNEFNQSDEMFVKIFLITSKINEDGTELNLDESMHDLFTECGGNLPQHCPYEGGGCLHNLICLDAKFDVKELCKKYNIRLYSDIYLMKIKKSEYNSGHEVYPVYCSNTDVYKVEKIRNIIRIFDNEAKRYYPYSVDDNYYYNEKNNTFIKKDDPSKIYKFN